MADEPLDEEALARAWEEDLAKGAAEEEKAPEPALPRTHEAPLSLDYLLDVPLTISVRVGESRMLIKDLLQLDKLAGEPMEVLINDQLVARGDVVLVNDKYGIRLTDIVSPIDRVKKL